MKYIGLDNLCEKLECEVLKNEPMSGHTSFKIGGLADRYICVSNVNSLKEILKFTKNNDIPVFILGNGSNILVSDKGVSGVVLSLTGDFKKIKLISDEEIYCGSAAMLSAVCIFAKNNSLSGMEFAYGIPGTLGGAAFMNAGAYGGEMKDVLVECFHVDDEGNEGSFKLNELELGYRKSVYSNKNFVITGMNIKLAKAEILEISDKMEELMHKRKSKQPLNFPSAGSTFKRPEGYFAAALIEECGLKGRTVGDAQVSEKHSGFVINKGTAKCQDVLDLIEIVKEEVKRQKSVCLECEVKIIGE